MFPEQFLREHDVLEVHPGEILSGIRVTKYAVIKSELKVFAFRFFDLGNVITGKVLWLSSRKNHFRWQHGDNFMTGCLLIKIRGSVILVTARKNGQCKQADKKW